MWYFVYPDRPWGFIFPKGMNSRDLCKIRNLSRQLKLKTNDYWWFVHSPLDSDEVNKHVCKVKLQASGEICGIYPGSQGCRNVFNFNIVGIFLMFYRYFKIIEFLRVILIGLYKFPNFFLFLCWIVSIQTFEMFRKTFHNITVFHLK